MKRTLIISCAFCIMAALTAVTGMSVGAANDAQDTSKASADDYASRAIPTSDNPTVGDSTSDSSPTQITVFGKSLGVYQFDWTVELNRAEEAQAERTDESSALIHKHRTDRSLMLSVKLPSENDDETLYVKIGLNIKQLIGQVGEEPSDQPAVTTQSPTSTTPKTITPTTATPTTAIPTTATPTTATPTTAAPTTQAPVTTEQTSGSGAIPERVPAMEYTDDDLLWLARIIQAEAGGVSMESKIAVGTVVLNRVESPKFPNTIYDVIFQKNQFSPVKSGSIYKTPSEDSYEAARRCLEGERTDRRILYFMMTKYAPGSWMDRTRELIVIIDSESFYA